MRYTKYICEKVPLSEPKFSQDLLLPNYAVLPNTPEQQAGERKGGQAACG